MLTVSRLTNRGIKGLAIGNINTWKRREELGRAACDSVQTSYNTHVLYSQLADSLRKERTRA